MIARILPMFPRNQCSPSAAAFDGWYALYPRKAARADAEKAYCQMLQDGHSHEAMLIGAQCYAEMCRKRGTEKQYMLLPASFLRGQRFLDEEILECQPPSEEAIATSKDRADRLLKRGIYAPK